MTQTINLLLIGAISLGSFIIGLFFLRFWKSTRDRFFLFFAASFLLEGVNRILLGAFVGMAEDAVLYYLIRLAAYCLIIVAIVDKNLIRSDQKQR
jgi:hypothetical protein